MNALAQLIPTTPMRIAYSTSTTPLVSRWRVGWRKSRRNRVRPSTLRSTRRKYHRSIAGSSRWASA